MKYRHTPKHFIFEIYLPSYSESFVHSAVQDAVPLMNLQNALDAGTLVPVDDVGSFSLF